MMRDKTEYEEELEEKLSFAGQMIHGLQSQIELYEATLHEISLYVDTEEVEAHADSVGLDYVEFLEMAYENIRQAAKDVLTISEEEGE